MSTTLYKADVESPLGTMTIVATDRGVRALIFDDRAQAGRDSERVRHLAFDAVDAPGHDVIAATAAQLDEYFAGERQDFDLPLDVVGTDFQRSAWTALQTIPFGATVSYGEQARRLGKPSAVRAVGAANGRNPVAIVVPCHRVVGADGSLTGYGGGLDSKAWLLDHERDVLARA